MLERFIIQKRKQKKKLSKEELDKVQSLNKKLYDSLLAIGDMEASIITLTRKKDIAFSEHAQTVEDMTQYKVDLGKKYESTKVDMSTGVLS